MAHIANLTTRLAHPEDAESIAQLHAESWRRHYRGAYSDDFLDGDVGADRLQVWTERLARPDGKTATFVTEDECVHLGFIHVVFNEDTEWGSLVDNLHVVWFRKRGGIGTQLMARAGAAVHERGQGGLYLWVLEQNKEAQAFYSAHGGSCAGQRLVVVPSGIADRLNGSPVALRFAWKEPTTLIV